MAKNKTIHIKNKDTNQPDNQEVREELEQEWILINLFKLCK
jgi:hypothetical protein